MKTFALSPGCACCYSPGQACSLFEGDDGKVYFVNGGAGNISLMKDDMSGFADTRPIHFKDPDHNPAHRAQMRAARNERHGHRRRRAIQSQREALPLRRRHKIDFAPDGKIMVAKDQPQWNLMPRQ
jgi:hypothetical protein